MNINVAAVQVLNPSFLTDCVSLPTACIAFLFICLLAFNNLHAYNIYLISNNRARFFRTATCWLGWGRFSKLTIFISCYVCSFITTTGKEHDNLSRHVCLPSASNYRRMRGARAGFVLKVNILYIKPYPALERFLLSTEWTSTYVSSDEVCTHRWGRGRASTHNTLNGCPHTHTCIHPPTHSFTDDHEWLSVRLCFFLF